MRKPNPSVYRSGHAMTSHLIEIYHNLDGCLGHYDPGNVLSEVISHWRSLPAAIAPEEVADWAFKVFNADLDHLAISRAEPGGEEDFLIAGVYRMLRRRSLSNGDVVAVSRDGHTTWLACEPTGWRSISPPPKRVGEPLTSAVFFRHARCRDA
ncbi:hypothetical protein FB565_000234 [Actinoplanes lutulentus]|uniref:Uncharacterized protein n=1 Tax=Actinoplanes lutulentus TaxID=1287878 RepID=A0A327YWD3_9ACTN|nr:hypothetical protein [Actinoplanes lutulentus]MBB2940530.1 hypothetical protein [Actinoplanes lutulentus]RAK24800.1 hypothetical protein B0I29_1356 [Actinoplanes lutulentus]